ncbi:MAG: hypothetical protein E7015_04115 [Alphaproteobacteria bacterium]|nr:hypothetical protein [Alphaproteobacteria bacterium]
MIIHRNFWEDSYIAEHANSKHLTQDSDSNGDFASFFDFSGVTLPLDKTIRVARSDLPTTVEDRKMELEKRARIVAESMYKWVLDPSIAQICAEPSGEEFSVFLKVTDFRKTADIRRLVYSSKSGKTTNLSQTIQLPIKSLLGTYTLSKSAFPCEDRPIPPETKDPNPFKRTTLLPIPDVASQKETLFAKLNKMQKIEEMASDQIELFNQLNIDDISWIIGKEIDVNPTYHGMSFSELLSQTPPDLWGEMVDNFKRHKPHLIEEIWFISKGHVNVTPLF